MTLQCLADEALGGQQVTMLAEKELDRVTDAVDGAIEIHPPAVNPDVGLIDMPLPGDTSLARVEPLQQQRREADDPAVDDL